SPTTLPVPVYQARFSLFPSLCVCVRSSGRQALGHAGYPCRSAGAPLYQFLSFLGAAFLVAYSSAANSVQPLLVCLLATGTTALRRPRRDRRRQVGRAFRASGLSSRPDEPPASQASVLGTLVCLSRSLGPTGRKPLGGSARQLRSLHQKGRLQKGRDLPDQVGIGLRPAR